MELRVLGQVRFPTAAQAAQVALLLQSGASGTVFDRTLDSPFRTVWAHGRYLFTETQLNSQVTRALWWTEHERLALLLREADAGMMRLSLVEGLGSGLSIAT